MPSHTRINRWAMLAVGLGLFTSGACAPSPPPGVVLVERRPPRDQVEVIAVSPGPGNVWMRGYWRWDRNDYVWVPGRWAPVERGYRRWEPGRWVHQRRGWYWVDGHWR